MDYMGVLMRNLAKLNKNQLDLVKCVELLPIKWRVLHENEIHLHLISEDGSKKAILDKVKKEVIWYAES